jgi:hypothetical protein
LAKDEASKFRVVKTLRLSQTLLQKIKTECAARNLRFSAFMRKAAVAWLEAISGASASKPDDEVNHGGDGAA